MPAASGQAKSAADSAPKLLSDQENEKARTWYFSFRVPITATITAMMCSAISKYDEWIQWTNFWKDGLDSQFRKKNITTADIICISIQEIASNLGSNDEPNDLAKVANHHYHRDESDEMNELGISDAGSYLICDGFIRGDNMRHSTVLKWLSPEQTRLDISNLLLTPIVVLSGCKTHYSLHPSIHKFLSAGKRRGIQF